MNKKNKKNSGCVYTKKWVVKMMLDLCGYTPENDLSGLTVVEPSCGEGSFVIEMADRLCRASNGRNVDLEKLAGCIKAYDIDANALAIVREDTFDLLTLNGFEPSAAKALVDHWFIEGDFIESEGIVADLVIGNPPYIRATDIPKDIRLSYCKRLDAFTMGTDMYIAFMEKGVRALKAGGKLCFICSDRWQKNQSGEKFRKFIEKQKMHLSFNCHMHDVEAFEKEVTAYPAITMIQHGEGACVDIVCNASFDAGSAQTVVADYRCGKCSPDDGSFAYASQKERDTLIEFPTIEEAGITIGIGIATGKDAVFITENPDIVEKNRLVPLAYARDIKDCQFPATPVKWLINPWEQGDLVELDEYPKLREYFYEHEEELKGRHVARKHPEKWFRTIDKLHVGLQSREKLLIRDMSNGTEPIYDAGQYYPHHNLYWMASETWDMEILGGILLSETICKMMEKNSVKMRGGVIRNQAQYLRKLRVPPYSLISAEDKKLLKDAFRKRDRSAASIICERLYR